MENLTKVELIEKLTQANELLYNVLQLMKAQDDSIYAINLFELQYNITHNKEIITCDGSSLQVDIADFLNNQGIKLSQVETDNIQFYIS